MIGILQERERVQAEPFVPGEMLDGFGRLQNRQEKRKHADHQPHYRAAVSRQRRSVRVQRADQPATEHPTEGGHGADGTELFLRIRQSREDNRRGNAPRWGGAERVELNQREHEPRIPTEFDGGAGQRHGNGGGQGQTPEDFHR